MNCRRRARWAGTLGARQAVLIDCAAVQQIFHAPVDLVNWRDGLQVPDEHFCEFASTTDMVLRVHGGADVWQAFDPLPSSRRVDWQAVT